MFTRIWLLLWTFAVLFSPLPNAPATAQDETPMVLVLTADGPLTPAMREYLVRGIRTARQQQASLLVLQLNTPGGSIDLMDTMVADLLASDVPIVVYVSPRGANAGSAGTVVTLAAHVAAMAPDTVIGAASPVGGEGEDLGETMEAKIKNTLRAKVRTLTERRGSEATSLAEDTIEDAIAVSAREAFEVGLVDFIASDVDDLLRQLDGFIVLVDGEERELRTANASVVRLPLTFIEQVLQTLTNPNIVFLLVTIGVQAILIELSNPGGWAPGFIGVVCLALATYGLGILPVNWFGLVFVGLAFALFVLEIKTPTIGALTAAGVASLIVGALVLFNSPSTPSFQRVSVPLVVITSLITAGFFGIILTFALKAQRVPILTGEESLAGKIGIARSDISPRGSVHVAGEMWIAELAEGEQPIQAGAPVEVTRVKGLRLYVRGLPKKSA